MGALKKFAFEILAFTQLFAVIEILSQGGRRIGRKFESVSTDTIEDKSWGLHYLVKMRTQKTGMADNNQILSVIGSMLLTADIVIDKMTVLGYC